MASSGPSGTARNCVSCGRSFAWDANVCPYCGHDYRIVMAGPMAATKKETSMPMIGGILILIGGILLLLATFWCIITIALAIVALLGGVFAIQRKHFTLALIGGILSIPSIIGIVGLILVIVSKDEFS